MEKQVGARIGLMSRIDYGSSDFRAKLVAEGRKVFKEEKTDFDILVGGLVSGEDVEKRIKACKDIRREEIKSRLNALKSESAKSKEAAVLEIKKLKDALEQICKKVAGEIEAFRDEAQDARESEEKAEAQESIRKLKYRLAQARLEFREKAGAVREKFKKVVADFKLKMAEARIFDTNACKNEVIRGMAKELADLIPRRYDVRKGKDIKLYVMISPAYDGRHGLAIAEELTALRDDIKLWAGVAEIFPLKPAPHPSLRRLLCVVPKSRNFYSEYSSTPVDRVLKRLASPVKKMQGDVMIVGPFGSTIVKPKGGESKRPVITVPACRRISEDSIKDAPENQIGVIVLELAEDGQIFRHRHSFNDLLLDERQTLKISPSFTEIETRILECFREASSWTPGLLETPLGMPRVEIEKNLKSIMEKNRKGAQPPIVFDPRSGRYFIDHEYIQKHLEYPYAGFEKGLDVDTLLGFACIHVLSKYADHDFMVRKIAGLILKYGVRVLAGAGDLIEGREHSLASNGEVVHGANYSQQEETAAEVVAEIVLRVFEVLLTEATKDKKLITKKALQRIIEKCLIIFIYIAGNHDEWVEKYGFMPLRHFELALLRALEKGIWGILKERNLPEVRLDELIEKKVLRGCKYTLPSGITVSLTHLHMGRSKTKTLRGQEILDFRDQQVNIHGNFHTAIAEGKYDAEVGEREVMQLGTLKHGSGFEKRKGKKVDFGVGFLRVYSKKNGTGPRIIRSTAAYFGVKPEYRFEAFSNNDAVHDFVRGFGVRDDIILK